MDPYDYEASSAPTADQQQPAPLVAPQPEGAVTITTRRPPSGQGDQGKVPEPQALKPLPPDVSCYDPKPSVVILGTICLFINLILSGSTFFIYMDQAHRLRSRVEEVYYIGLPSALGLNLLFYLFVFIGSCKRISCLLWFSLFLNVLSLLSGNGICFYFSLDEYDVLAVLGVVTLDIVSIWFWVCISIFAVYPDPVVRTFYHGPMMRMNYQHVPPVMGDE